MILHVAESHKCTLPARGKEESRTGSEVGDGERKSCPTLWNVTFCLSELDLVRAVYKIRCVIFTNSN
jgi:hypothetical protein